jgi:hypothetical protein
VLFRHKSIPICVEGVTMSEFRNTTELLDTIAKVLLRCAIFGFLLLALWFVFHEFAPATLRGGYFGATPHEADLVDYCGIALTKVLVILLFVLPYISIRLVLRKISS